MPDAPKALITRASEDKERFVTEFATNLRAAGIDAWVDEWEIRAGDSIVDKVFAHGIDKVDVFGSAEEVFLSEGPHVRYH